MTKRKIVALSILILILCAGYAAASHVPISGKILDLATNYSVPYAQIYVTNLNTGATDSVKSDHRGNWNYEFVTSTVEDNGFIPGKFQVSPNYPNPFNPSTRVNFYLPGASSVTAVVHNILGETVELQKTDLSAGYHSLTWSGKGSAGVYFLTIKTRFGSATQKMTQIDQLNGSGFSGFVASANTRLTKPAGSIPVRIIVTKFSYAPDTIEAEIQGNEYFEIKLETLHSRALVVDLHNDILEKMLEDSDYHLADFHSYNHTDIPRMKIGGVDLQFFAVWVSPTRYVNHYFDTALRMLDIFDSEMALNSDAIVHANSAGEVLSIVADKKIAAAIGVEGGHSIENKIENLIALYERGMRYMTITWNNSTDWAVSAKDSRSRTVGLSEFGKKVIRTMDSLGVIIDVSHTGIKTIEDILAVTKNPIVATHSGVRALRDRYRNLYDDQIVAIANTGGVIGVVFYPPFLSSTGYASIATVANHIDYI
ncbi:MAG: T9SS type A sorting domain-containing protein, partial [Calditrichaeota bacterium]|nr:T9SS type A sorting domain-containing protein [Calditrichota bacterium]